MHSVLPFHVVAAGGYLLWIAVAVERRQVMRADSAGTAVQHNGKIEVEHIQQSMAIGSNGIHQKQPAMVMSPYPEPGPVYEVIPAQTAPVQQPQTVQIAPAAQPMAPALPVNWPFKGPAPGVPEAMPAVVPMMAPNEMQQPMYPAQQQVQQPMANAMPYVNTPMAAGMQPMQQPVLQPMPQVVPQPMQQPVQQQPVQQQPVQQQPVQQQPVQQQPMQQPMQQPVLQPMMQPMQQPVQQQPQVAQASMQPMQQPVQRQPLQQPQAIAINQPPMQAQPAPEQAPIKAPQVAVPPVTVQVSVAPSTTAARPKWPPSPPPPAAVLPARPPPAEATGPLGISPVPSAVNATIVDEETPAKRRVIVMVILGSINIVAAVYFLRKNCEVPSSKSLGNLGTMFSKYQPGSAFTTQSNSGDHRTRSQTGTSNGASSQQPRLREISVDENSSQSPSSEEDPEHHHQKQHSRPAATRASQESAQ
jgi:hypothetical protein